MIKENSIRTGEFSYMPICEEVIFRNDGKSGLPIGGDGPIGLKGRIISGEISPEEVERAKTEFFRRADVFEMTPLGRVIGCMDGRPTEKVIYTSPEKNADIIESFSNDTRPKGPGGTLLIREIELLATGKKFTDIKELAYAGNKSLDESGIYERGAHTDDHAKHSEDKCGCGAIDYFPNVIADVERYQDNIRDILSVLVDGFNEDIYKKVIENFTTGLSELDLSDYSGKKKLAGLYKKPSEIKVVKGKHKEVFIVLNMVDGTTLNQEKLVEYSDEKLQAFCIDIWKLKEEADLYGGTADEKLEAYYGVLAYTISLSRFLTSGDQKVMLRK